MRILFYKHDFAWPRSSGHDVHTYNMMRSLADLGARVGLVSRTAAPDAALAGVALDLRESLDSRTADVLPRPRLSGPQERFRNYWGVSEQHIARFGDYARSFKADAVVVSGLDVLTMLGAVRNATRVWYAADEWLWHHLSQVRVMDTATWPEVRDGVIKGAYERAYRSVIDRVWVVSHADARAMRLVAGVKDIDVLPNGVDGHYYQPLLEPGARDTAVFWGRLDFGPNIQALAWFCRGVWPEVRRRHPDASFTIIGFAPSPEVNDMARLPGITLKPDVPDIRDEVDKHAVVVLPFVSGGGIKNKLLEAAAMARPTICSSRARLGLVGSPPLMTADSAQQWVQALTDAWADPPRASRRGLALRDWVTVNHSWQHIAEVALSRLDSRERLAVS